jgi:hypothetical protein
LGFFLLFCIFFCSSCLFCEGVVASVGGGKVGGLFLGGVVQKVYRVAKRGATGGYCLQHYITMVEIFAIYADLTAFCDLLVPVVENIL